MSCCGGFLGLPLLVLVGVGSLDPLGDRVVGTCAVILDASLALVGLP